MSTTHTKWMKLRCDASLQSPTAYGSSGYRVEPPPAPEGKVRCPVCWKPVKLMQRSGFGGRRIPTHNYDHDMVLQKEAAMEAARKAAMAKTLGAGRRCSVIDPIQDHTARVLALAACKTAQAETKRHNEAATQRQREAAAIGAELDPESLEQESLP